MVNNIVTCGDSFACGTGIDDEVSFERSFGGLVASHYGLPNKILARPGCCNYVIYLQIRKAISDALEKNTKPLVLVSVTHHSRFTFPSDYSTGVFRNYTLEDVDYNCVSPYSNNSKHKRDLPFIPTRNPRLISDTVGNFLHYIETCEGKSSIDQPTAIEKYFSNIKTKIPAMKLFYEHLYDDSIKQIYDYSLLLMAHNLLDEHQIPHIILDSATHYCRFIKEENYLENHWGEYCVKYPDSYKSGHCDERGHVEVAEKIINKINQHRMI